MILQEKIKNIEMKRPKLVIQSTEIILVKDLKKSMKEFLDTIHVTNNSYNKIIADVIRIFGRKLIR